MLLHSVKKQAFLRSPFDAVILAMLMQLDLRFHLFDHAGECAEPTAM